MNLMDSDKVREVALYSFICKINGDRYLGQIPATSYEDAVSKVALFGGEVDGRLTDEISEDKAVCVICAGNISKDLTNVKPVEDITWDDILE